LRSELSFVSFIAIFSNCQLPALIAFGENLAQSIELSFPRGAVIANPLFESAKSCGFYTAGTDPTQFFGVH
jgi:hypothetical protein